MGTKKLRAAEVKKAEAALWKKCNRRTQRLRNRIEAILEETRKVQAALRARCMHNRLKRQPLCYIDPKRPGKTRIGYDCPGCCKRLWLTEQEYEKHMRAVRGV